MLIYCWKNTVHGELDVGVIENERAAKANYLNWNDANIDVIQVSFGCEHTLFLTSNGRVFSYQIKDNRRIDNDVTNRGPQVIVELQNYVIVQISCGSNHFAALSEWGQLFCWGRNDYGQLGISNKCSETVLVPKIIRTLISKNVLQVACGNNHTLALTSCGELYAWGLNIHGQLGVAETKELVHINVPVLVVALTGIPIANITAGGNHSFVVSKSGAVFGWGSNSCGQLGLNDYVNRCYPSQLRTLRSRCVRYIACGEDFSAFLTNDGGVFTCGSGIYGQLGHGCNSNESLPRMVMELMGSTVTQIACGSRHILAFVPSHGRIFGFGLGCSGQLGARVTSTSRIPQVVVGPWVLSNDEKTLPDSDENNILASGCAIKQIFCGGDHTVVVCLPLNDKSNALDYRIYNNRTQILYLTEEAARQCVHIEHDGNIDMDLLANFEMIFKSQACINASFLLPDERHLCCTSKHHGVCFISATTAFNYLGKVENQSLKTIIWEKIAKELLPSLTPSPADVETLRIYLILPLYHEFVNSKNYESLHAPFSNAVLSLNEIPRKIIFSWWCQTPDDWFENIVSNYKNAVAYIISFKLPSYANGMRMLNYNAYLGVILRLLVFLYRIYHTERKGKLHYEIFHWTELTDYVDIQQEYLNWRFEKQPNTFNICNYPFLFNAATKTTLLQTDQAVQMHHAMQTVSSNFFSVYEFIVLNVSRENLVADTLREIMQHNQMDWKKPLKIKFSGEEAEDAGGVRKEFFMLLIKDLIDPKYCMFKQYDDSKAVWFADVTFETEDMYSLIGTICGLAIYNFTIINLPFPLALYKKLLAEKIELSDLYDLSPTLAKSMQQILDYNGDDFQQTFELFFEITRDVFGDAQSIPLKPGGENIPVTLENRQEFVDLYVDFIFNKSVENQFRAFQNGFMKVCWGGVLQIFRAEELMAMVVGNEEYDWQAFEHSCEYKNGYTNTDQTIKWFWEVFHSLPLAEKKKFLLFLTGSDRIPIQGMKAIKISIQPVYDDKFLPLAHTCFNLLDLPRYRTKERLKYKLLQAIQQTQVFSIV